MLRSAYEHLPYVLHLYFLCTMSVPIFMYKSVLVRCFTLLWSLDVHLIPWIAPQANVAAPLHSVLDYIYLDGCVRVLFKSFKRLNTKSLTYGSYPEILPLR